MRFLGSVQLWIGIWGGVRVFVDVVGVGERGSGVSEAVLRVGEVCELDGRCWTVLSERFDCC